MPVSSPGDVQVDSDGFGDDGGRDFGDRFSPRSLRSLRQPMLVLGPGTQIRKHFFYPYFLEMFFNFFDASYLFRPDFFEKVRRRCPAWVTTRF